MRHDLTQVLAALLLGVAPSASAQQAADTARTPVDSAIVRARQLSNAGNDTAARRVIDSLFRATSPDSAAYADVLYWRAALAADAADAERDYSRLLIEAPLSARAEDALLQLAKLEQARGDRAAATDHLQRFLLSYPNNPERPRAALALVRLQFEQGQVARACEALRAGRESVPPENAELRNQLDFYAPRCVTVESPVASSDSAAADSARADSLARASRVSKRKPAAAPKTPKVANAAKKAEAAEVAKAAKAATVPASTSRARTGFYSVQVAAYDSPEPARRMVQMLAGRGVEARVDGQSRPYRVRVGKYAARTDAVKAAAALKRQGFTGFITLVR